MADLPFDFEGGLAERLARVLDVEGKIPRAFEALGPVGGRDVVLVDGPAGIRARQLSELGARVTLIDSSGPAWSAAPDDSADVVIACWSAFRGGLGAELTEAERILRPGGRLLVVHDYGRDDVATMLGDPPEPHARSRRDGPFLHAGFKIRVIHCFLTFESIDDAGAFLAEAFGDAGRTMHAGLARPRVTYNVAVFHRTFDGSIGEEPS